LRYAWASPATLVGLMVSAIALVLGARARCIEGAIEVGGGRLAAWMRRLPTSLRFGAVTFGHVILGLDDPTLAHCRVHEHVHVRQYERWGIFLFPAYLAASLYAWLRGGDAYRDNAFEREARGEAAVNATRGSSRR
jgi:hypothetical protein